MLSGKFKHNEMNRSNPLCILASCLFPPVPWMAALIQNENCVIDTHETYAKQTFRNRFTILSSNGRLDQNVPVIKPNGNHTKTCDIRVAKKVSGQHLAAIESAYSSGPYFEYFFDDVRNFYNEEYQSLEEMNDASIRCIGSMLRQRFSYGYSPTFMIPGNGEETDNDLRYLISPKNGNFFNFEAPEYYQVFRHKFRFQSNLSILDLVMNMGPEAIICLKNYPLQHLIEYLKQT